MPSKKLFSFQLRGIPGVAFYAMVSAWNWMGSNSQIIFACIFMIMAWRDDGLFAMLWLGFALMLQGQYWIQKDIDMLKGAKNASVPHK